MASNKRQTAAVFRERLLLALAASGMNRTALAAAAGTDRSTLSQLLSADAVRLPRADTIAALATAVHVSVDWLLGLTEEKGSLGTDVFNEAVVIERGAALPSDARLARWHAEASGYKIRYVPATLPDLLKTEEVMRYEYAETGNALPDRRIEQAEEGLAYNRLPETDMEVCSSWQSALAFARGEMLWSDLTRSQRRRQLAHMADLLDELYPTFRWFLFNGRRQYSAPMTVFGPRRVALYLGDLYLVINATEHVRMLTRHFDELIRGAVIQPPGVAAYLRGLADEV